MSQVAILHLISSADFLGAERVVCELASEIATKDGFKVHLALMGATDSLVKPFQLALGDSNVFFYYFPAKGKLDLRAIKMIRCFIADNGISLIHCHGYKSDIYAYLVRRFAGSTIRLLATNHTWKMRTLTEKIYKHLDLCVLKRFEQIVAVSDAVSNEMTLGGLDARKIHMIFNGISTTPVQQDNSLSMRVSLGLDNESIVVGCVASLTEEKAHKDLIAAFALLYENLPNIRLLLIGDGPLREDLTEQVGDLGLSGLVVFAGRRNDVRELYSAMDVFTLVSYNEGLPMAMLEAMAAGLPVVVTPVGAIPNVIIDGEQGLLAPAGDPAAQAAALHKLIVDPALRTLMGQVAYETVVKQYSSKRMAANYEQLYRQMLEMA